jgi:hypothetical protein
MAKFRSILLIARLVTGLLGFAALLLVVVAVAVHWFLPPSLAWVPTRTVQAMVALALINVGLSIGLLILRGFMPRGPKGEMSV